MIPSHQKRIWFLSPPRLDSRLLLRCLIGFNIVLAFYNLITLQANTKSGKSSSPCVVVINTSKGAQNAAQQAIEKVTNI